MEGTRQQLVEWMVTAKKSLQVAEQRCSRANHLLNQTHAYLSLIYPESIEQSFEGPPHKDMLDLEGADRLKSKDANKQELTRQQNQLHRTLEKFRQIRESCVHEFEQALSRLDALDMDLNQSLASLKSIRVAHVLAQNTGADGSLYHYVDDKGIESLKAQMRSCMDQADGLHEKMASIITQWEQEQNQISDRIRSMPDLPILPIMESTHDSIDEAEMTNEERYLANQEHHAASMADLLTQLSNHYDQCAHALKEFEVLDATERQELMDVLARDTGQLEDIMDELEELLNGLENTNSRVLTFKDQHLQIAHSIRNISGDISGFTHTHESSHLKKMRNTESQMMQVAQDLNYMQEPLVALTGHYKGFAAAYDAVILEIDRRQKTQSNLVDLVESTNSQIKQIVNGTSPVTGITNFVDEQVMREDFRHSYGDYLPSDLWTGVVDEPANYDLQEIAKANDIPTVTSEEIQQALARTNARYSNR